LTFRPRNYGGKVSKQGFSGRCDTFHICRGKIVVQIRKSDLKIGRILSLVFAIVAPVFLAPGHALAGTSGPGSCPRPAEGSEVQPPPDLFSAGGKLKLALNYWTDLDSRNRTLFCFVTPDGVQSPTLHVNPGDTIEIALTNHVPLPPHTGGQAMMMDVQCGARLMTLVSVNMHFHGTNTSPQCGHDEAIRTLVNSGQTFTYTLHIPSDEPPGLYWYHPHVHGIASMAVEGGASGLIVVEGIENVQPAVAGLPQRLLILRDQPLAYQREHGKKPQPNWDVSLNFVPVPYPHYPPAIIKMQRGTQEFWRVSNSSANTVMDLQVKYDGKAQPLQVAALDGVPTGSQDGKRQGTLITERDILLPPASRAEFIVAAPPSGTVKAQLITRNIDGGPAADSNPARPIADIVAVDTPVHLPRMPERSRPPSPQRFENILNAKVTAKRKLFFSETPSKIGDGRGAEGVNFFITVDGTFRHLFNPNNPPDIITNKGAVEDWVIENRSSEVHEFHIHQIHFLLLGINGNRVPKEQQQWYDTFQVPYWDGISDTYPSIKVRMDFRGAVVGDFVYHCHILEHEDAGMMAIIRVLPPA